MDNGKVNILYSLLILFHFLAFHFVTHILFCPRVLNTGIIQPLCRRSGEKIDVRIYVCDGRGYERGFEANKVLKFKPLLF